MKESKGIGFVMYEKMLEHKEKIAQIDGISGEKQTYACLLKRSIRAAITLREKGITNEDIVMTCSLNYMDTCVPLFATQFLGAVTSALDPTLSFDDVVHLMKQVPPKIIFVMPELTELIENVFEKVGLDTEIVVFGHTERHTPFSDFLRPSKLEEAFRPTEINARNRTAFILFSSGTSGLPKGIRINNFRCLENIQIMIRFGHCYDVNLSTTSLYWITANLFLLVTILKGATRIVLPGFNPATVWNAIDNYQVTIIYANPLQLVQLSAEKQGNRGDSMQHILTGGVQLFQKHVDAVKFAFPKANLFSCYGQTETGLIAIFNSQQLELLQKNPLSCGPVIPEYSYRILDLETREDSGPNKTGELLIKGDIMFEGYYNMDSSDVWEDGWYKTGDIVFCNNDGCLFIVDRVKEVLKYQSWHVTPASIEQILVTHPAVENCIVIGIPHEMDGEHPLAVVVLRESFRHTKPEEIQKFVDDQVDDRKKLRGGVKIIPKFPVQGAGKVKRRIIKNMVLSGEL